MSRKIIPPARADRKSGFANGIQKEAEGNGDLQLTANPPTRG